MRLPYVSPTLTDRGQLTHTPLDCEAVRVYVQCRFKTRHDTAVQVQAAVRGRLGEMSEETKTFFDVMFGEEWRAGAA